MVKCVCHADGSTAADWGINRAHMWDSPSHTHKQARTHTREQNPQLDLRASFCLSYCPLIPSSRTPISSRRGFMRGRTSSLRHNTISIGLSTALFQDQTSIKPRYYCNTTMGQLYLFLSPSFRPNTSESDVINIDSAIVCRHFISMYIRLKCPTAKTLYVQTAKSSCDSD